MKRTHLRRPVAGLALSMLLLAFVLEAVAAEKHFDVRAFGAKGDGTTLDTEAIQKAIDACAAAGGGKVEFPTGRYLSGSLELRSGVRLAISPRATLLGSKSLSDYRSRRLLSATDAEQIGIEGGGTIDGQGEAFWEKRSTTYQGPTYRGTAQFNYRALARPSFVHFLRCRNIVLRDIKLVNSPSWTVHLQRCQDAMVEKITIRNPLYGPNTDGIDINSCIRVTVRDCDIVTGDDGVVLKSTEPGHDHPSREITVEGCRIWSACNGLKLGTETHDRFDQIVFRKCHLYSDSANPLDRTLAGVAIESVDGSNLTGIHISDLTMKNVRAPLFIRLGHRGGNSPRSRQVEPRVPGTIRQVSLRNITAEGSMFESSITGIPGHRVEDVTLENLRLQYEGGGKADWVLGDVPDEAVIGRYPEAQMFGRLPAYGLYCRHVNHLAIRDLAVTCLKPDPRPVLVGDDVQQLSVNNLSVPSAAGQFPLVWLQGVGEALFRQCAPPQGTGTFVAIEQEATGGDRVKFESCDLRHVATPLARLAPGGLVASQLPLFEEQKPGRVAIEAEAMRLIDPMVVEPAPTGKAILVSGPGGREIGSARCRFSIKTAGDYRIWVLARASSGESNSFYAGVDRHRPALVDVQRLGAWHWVLVRDRQSAKHTAIPEGVQVLSAGIHRLEIRNRESGTEIDRVVIVRADAKFDPATGF